MRLTKFFPGSKPWSNIGIKPLSLLILTSIFLCPASGQEQNNVQQQDTVKKRPQFYIPELFLTQPTLLPPQSYGAPQESFSDFLNQSLTVPMPPFSWRYETNLDLLTSWKQELAKQEEYQTLRTILGSIEMGGVAYLTYLHFKKYGLK
jgi:hypothetical protein